MSPYERMVHNLLFQEKNKTADEYFKVKTIIDAIHRDIKSLRQARKLMGEEKAVQMIYKANEKLIRYNQRLEKLTNLLNKDLKQ